MKTTLTLAGLALALCSLSPAQDNNDERVVIPARNSTRPRKVTVRSSMGPITVKAYSGKEVIVESPNAAPQRGRREATPQGMRRLDVMPRGLSVEEQDNQIDIKAPITHGALVITVPTDTSLDLHTMHGGIKVDGVHGEIAVDSMNSGISLTDVSGNVLAHSLNGGIKVSLDRVDPAKPLSFITLNGTIDVTLPADYKGNIKAATFNGGVFTDFEVKLGGGTITRTNETGDGKYVVKIDRNEGISGTIGGGGPEATFKSHNGSIYIRKRK
jgi:DUF4097 and DUF4098 domain-containing protein YvlB